MINNKEFNFLNKIEKLIDSAINYGYNSNDNEDNFKLIKEIQEIESDLVSLYKKEIKTNYLLELLKLLEDPLINNTKEGEILIEEWRTTKKISIYFNDKNLWILMVDKDHIEEIEINDIKDIEKVKEFLI